MVDKMMTSYDDLRRLIDLVRKTPSVSLEIKKEEEKEKEEIAPLEEGDEDEEEVDELEE